MQDNKSKQFWLSIALTAVMTACLCLLGVWQLQRLQWKTALIDSFTHKETLAQAPNFNAWDVSISNPQPVLFFGYYLPQATVMIPQGDKSIVYMPFKTMEGVIVLMRRGTVPTAEVPDMVLGENENGKTIGVVGVPLPRPRIFPFLHVAKSGSLSWPFLDWQAVRYRFSEQPLAPYVVAVLEEPKGALNVTPAPPELRNEHLQYAIFWFVMAALCAGLFSRFFFFTPRGE